MDSASSHIDLTNWQQLIFGVMPTSPDFGAKKTHKTRHAFHLVHGFLSPMMTPLSSGCLSCKARLLFQQWKLNTLLYLPECAYFFILHCIHEDVCTQFTDCKILCPCYDRSSLHDPPFQVDCYQEPLVPQSFETGQDQDANCDKHPHQGIASSSI
jgi:hypothetical protein